MHAFAYFLLAVTAHFQTSPTLTGKRFGTVVLGVLLLHAVVLWAVQANLLQRAADKTMPVVMVVTQRAEPPKPAPPAPLVAPAPSPALLPKAEAAPQPKENKPLPVPKPALQPKEQQLAPAATPPAALPLASNNPAPAPNAPTGSLSPQTAAALVAAAAPAPAAAPTAAATIASTLPTVDAEHSANEALFRAPSISSRLGEFGSVGLMVTVGVSGSATRVSVVRSSGFTRLDNAALEGARKAKYKPATKGGLPVEASYPWTISYAAPAG